MYASAVVVSAQVKIRKATTYLFNKFSHTQHVECFTTCGDQSRLDNSR